MTSPPKSVDLKSLAQGLLGVAQRQLQRQGLVTPMVFMITPEGKQLFQIEEPDPEERQEIYANLLAQAREKKALALVTVAPIVFPGQSTAGTGEPQPQRAITVTVSGPGFKTWTLISRYARNGDQIVFQPTEEK